MRATSLAGSLGILVFVLVLVFMCRHAVDAIAAEPTSPPPAAADATETKAPLATPPAATTDDDESEMVIEMSSWYERIRESSTGDGGFIMYVLMALSVVAFGFSLERFFHLRRNSLIPPGLSVKAMQLWQAEDHDGIKKLCHDQPSTLANVILTLVNHRHCSSTELTQIAGDTASRDIRLEMQKAYPLQVVATLAPLLGLLGTVVGMVLAFEKVSGAGSMGNAAILADDISLALITTMLGLIIAAPTLALYHFFRSKTVKFSLLLEGEVNELMAAWFLSDKK